MKRLVMIGAVLLVSGPLHATDAATRAADIGLKMSSTLAEVALTQFVLRRRYQEALVTLLVRQGLPLNVATETASKLASDAAQYDETFKEEAKKFLSERMETEGRKYREERAKKEPQ